MESRLEKSVAVTKKAVEAVVVSRVPAVVVPKKAAEVVLASHLVVIPKRALKQTGGH